MIHTNGMRSQRTILILVSGAAFLDFLDVTVVNLAFPALRREFAGSSVSDLAWVITGYAVMFAALLAASGRLSDAIGRRRVFLTGVALFTLASLASAVAPSLGLLIAARFVQGAGAALSLPSGLGIVLSATPPERRAAAVGVWGASAAAAAAVGPTVGGLLVDGVDWRAVFLINVPLGAAILILGRRVLPATAGGDGRRVPDLVGTVAIAAGIGLVVLAVTKATDWGWGSEATTTSLVAGLGLAALGLARSRRHPAPALEIDLWRSRSFAISNVSSLFFGAAVYAWLLAGVLFLTGVWRYSEIEAGLAMSPGAVSGAVAAALAGRLVDRRGQRGAVVGGALLLAAVGVWVYEALGTHPDFLGFWLPAGILCGAGMGIGAVGLSAAAPMAVAQERFAAATGLNMTARVVGGALGVAALAAILTSELRQGVQAYADVFLFCSIAASVAAMVGLGLSLKPAPSGTEERLPAGAHAAA
jgi:EmrB/QacA subfamily drug resistance transporter